MHRLQYPTNFETNTQNLRTMSIWRFRYHLLGLACLCAVVTFLLHSEVILYISAVLAFGVILVFLYQFSATQRKIRAEKHRTLAARNNFDYYAIAYLTHPDCTFVNGMLQTTMRNVLSGVIDGVPFTKGDVSYDANKGRTAHILPAAIVTIYLERPVPHIFLASKKLVEDDRPDGIYRYTGKHVIELEGYFNSFFTTYVAKQYERDALYILTPELMEQLCEYAAVYDVEFIDDQVLIYMWNDLQYSQADFERLAEIVAILGRELRDNTANYLDDKAINRAKRSSQILKGQTPETPVVADAGARLL